MTKRILITGANGFVGRQVMRALSSLDVKIRVIARSTTAPTDEFKSITESIIYSSDLFSETPEWWAEKCRDVDTVIHLAWYVEPGEYLFSAENINCLIGTLNLAKGSLEAKVRRFVGIGTCFEYDMSAGLLSVETALAPNTPYAGAKSAAYLALSQCLPPQGMEFVWCRLFYLFGEGEDSRRLVPHLRERLRAGEPVELTSGEQIRDYMDVQEAGSSIAKVAMGNQVGPVNICSGAPITVRQLAERIADEYGRRDLLRFGARPNNAVDPPYVVGVKTEG